MNVEQIGSNIEKLRKQKNLTQQELGECIGMTASAISNIECSRSMPSVETLCKFAEFFEVTMDLLLSEKEQCDFQRLEIEGMLCTVDRYLSKMGNSEISTICSVGNRNYRLRLREGEIEYYASSLKKEKEK